MKIYGSYSHQQGHEPKGIVLQNLVCHSHPEAPLRLNELSDDVSCSLKPACSDALALS